MSNTIKTTLGYLLLASALAFSSAASAWNVGPAPKPSDFENSFGCTWKLTGIGGGYGFMGFNMIPVGSCQYSSLAVSWNNVEGTKFTLI